MYTQNHITKFKENHIVTFPNKDSIIQMKTLGAKCELQKEDRANHEQQPSITSDSHPDYLLILGALLSLTDDESINSTLFTLIAGVLLSI